MGGARTGSPQGRTGGTTQRRRRLLSAVPLRQYTLENGLLLLRLDPVKALVDLLELLF